MYSKGRLERRAAMDDKHWGHCRTCKFFGSPAHVPLDSEEARCQQPKLAKFQLAVFGASGCNAWELRRGFSAEIEERPVVAG
jgi:hypothetical protein